MKKTLLFSTLFASVSLFAQDPVIQNSTMDNIERDGSTDCSCAGWTNKDLGDQPESSSWESDTYFGLKLDDRESDAIYQEIAVETNTNYKFTYYYNFEDKETDDLASSLEVRILSGSGYIADYSPSYPTPFSASSTGYGYTDISEVEDADNNLASATISAPDNDDFKTGELTFNSGSDTSIAIFLRGIGRNVTGVDGKGYAWSNGSHEIRIDYVSMINEGIETSVSDVFDSHFSIYPLPSKDLINITSVDDIDQAEVTDLTGKVVLTSSDLGNKTLDISSLSSGLYILKLISGDVIATTDFIKE